MQAAVCATSRGDCSRSSRDISESCSELGISSGAVFECVAFALAGSASDSITVLVSSSANNGTPSVFATISSRTCSGRCLPADTELTTCRHASAPRRGSCMVLRSSNESAAGSNSGRAVTSNISGRVDSPCVSTDSNSMVVGSIQCASSSTSSTGFNCPSSDGAGACNTADSACSVNCRRCTAVYCDDVPGELSMPDNSHNNGRTSERASPVLTAAMSRHRSLSFCKRSGLPSVLLIPASRFTY